MNIQTKTDNEHRHLDTIYNSWGSTIRYIPHPFYELSEPSNRHERRALKALKTHKRKAAKRGAQR